MVIVYQGLGWSMLVSELYGLNLHLIKMEFLSTVLVNISHLDHDALEVSNDLLIN